MVNQQNNFSLLIIFLILNTLLIGNVIPLLGETRYDPSYIFNRAMKRWPTFFTWQLYCRLRHAEDKI